MSKKNIKNLNIRKIMCLLIAPNGNFIYNELSSKDQYHYQSLIRLANTINFENQSDFNFIFSKISNHLFKFGEGCSSEGYIFYCRTSPQIKIKFNEAFMFLPQSITKEQEAITKTIINKMQKLDDFYVYKYNGTESEVLINTLRFSNKTAIELLNKHLNLSTTSNPKTKKRIISHIKI